jgi:hypothetical protein
MWAKYAFGDNRLGIYLPGPNQTLEVLADRPFGPVLGAGIENSN